jgi:hypothetical protein
MRNCQIGWIDIFFWNDWEPGLIPQSCGARPVYEKKLAAHIIKERYTSLVEQGISIRIGFRDYDYDDGADISVYGQFTADSCMELVKKANWCINYVPEGHAFDLLYGRLRLTEKDFDDEYIINAEALQRLLAVDARAKKQAATHND